MRTTSFRPLIATAMAVLAFSLAGMEAATTYVVPAASVTTQVALDQSGMSDPLFLLKTDSS